MLCCLWLVHRLIIQPIDKWVSFQTIRLRWEMYKRSNLCTSKGSLESIIIAQTAYLYYFYRNKSDSQKNCHSSRCIYIHNDKPTWSPQSRLSYKVSTVIAGAGGVSPQSAAGTLSIPQPNSRRCSNPIRMYEGADIARWSSPVNRVSATQCI